jgi:ABC-type uncharacterized transport system permease subunit
MILLGILLIALFAAGLWLVLSHLGLAAHTPWLAAHIVSAALAYVMFALSVVSAWLFMRRENDLRLGAPTSTNTTRNASFPSSLPLLTLEQWMFRFIYAGFALLSLSLLLGAITGGASFVILPQHKTYFALLAWLCFGVLIAGRIWLGWRGKQAVRLAYSGSIFLLLAYVGTRFVLEVLLGR